MTEATDLLPCPFCGGDAEIVDAVEAGESAKVVCCKRCLSSSKVVFALMDDVTFDLASAWNTRARPMTVAEAAKVLLGDDYRSPMLIKLDGFCNDADVAEDVRACLRAMSQGGE